MLGRIRAWQTRRRQRGKRDAVAGRENPPELEQVRDRARMEGRLLWHASDPGPLFRRRGSARQERR